MAKLCSDPQIQKLFQEYVRYFKDEEELSGFPRFEELSLRARDMPFFVYDNPAFVKLCSTAYTDFRSIYFNKDFLIGLMKCDEIALQRKLPANHVLFVIAHEVFHNFNFDDARLSLLENSIANVAQDINNNLQLQFGFGGKLKVYPEIMKEVLGFTGYGLTKEELHKYGRQSSDTIGLELFKAIVEKQKSNQSKQDGSRRGKSGQPNNSTQSEQSNNPVDDFINSFEFGEPEQEKHTATAAEVANAAKEGGLPQSTIDMLGLTPKTAEQLAEIEELNKISCQNAGLQMQSIWEKLDSESKANTRAGDTPNFYEEKVKLDGIGRITWKVALDEVTSNAAINNDTFIQDEIIDEFFVNPALYDGSYVPMEQDRGILISIVDTSGSMRKPFIMSGFNESLASVDNLGTGNGVKECLVFPADTNIKNKHWVLTEHNASAIADELMLIGGGGTDFTIPIQNALLTAQNDGKKVNAVALFTDLDSNPPNFEKIESEIEGELPPVLFITDKQSKEYRDYFEKACNGKAVVYYYDEGFEADIQKIKDDLDSFRLSTSQDELNEAPQFGM